MYFQEEETLPTLIPINKKRKDNTLFDLTEQDKNKIGFQIMNVFQKDGKKQNQQEVKKAESPEKEPQEDITKPQVKIEDIEGRFKAANELISQQEKKQNFKNSDKWKELQKSKNLVDEIMNKINAKNISEELYPVTNETIQALLRKMDQEIGELKAEQERKQNSYLVNPTNQNLKKQLQSLKSSIDRATTIKQLYNQKIHLRNKIMILEKNIIGLKEQNQNLKIKINRGIETIQNHMHNLPCQKEKQLKIELNKLQISYQKEKEMREKLEINVSEIVLNFKRLFEEAQTARLTVTKKLAQLQQKQKKLTASIPHNMSSDQKGSIKNTSQIFSIDKKIKSGENKLLGLNSDEKTPKKVLIKRQFQTNKSKQPQKLSPPLFSMEEQIRKMRSNQLTIKKVK